MTSRRAHTIEGEVFHWLRPNRDTQNVSMDEQNQFEQVASNYQLVPAQKRPVRSGDWGLAGTQRKKTTASLISFFLPENVCQCPRIEEFC
jgi:hypothetical protein